LTGLFSGVPQDLRQMSLSGAGDILILILEPPNGFMAS